MNKKVLAFVICALILFSILISGCLTEEKEKDNEPEDPVVLKDAPTKLNETNEFQEIAFVDKKVIEPRKWSEVLKIRISKDGNLWYIITFNYTEPNSKIKCERENNGDVYWDVGEKIWFYEDGANYEPGTYFYCIIEHVSSKAAPILNSFVTVY